MTALRTTPPIEYPDSDGMPMADNTKQARYITTIHGGLDALFRDAVDVFVAMDNLWYPVLGRPDIRKAPDVYVAFGRPKGDRGSYKQWEEGGVPLTVVFEILSPGNRSAEMADKFEFYQRYGVGEYYVYDPDRGALFGYLRDGTVLAAIADMQGYVSPRLGVRFDLTPDGELNLYGPDGRAFETYVELASRADAERQRADAERQRADALAAKLRELGVEPPA